MEDNPDLKEKLSVTHRSTAGRPRLEEDQPTLLSTIIDIAMQGASADERRRTEVMRSA